MRLFSSHFLFQLIAHPPSFSFSLRHLHRPARPPLRPHPIVPATASCRWWQPTAILLLHFCIWSVGIYWRLKVKSAKSSILLEKVSGFLILVPWGLVCYKYAIIEREWIDWIILEIVIEIGCYWLYDLIGNHMCMLKLSCEGMRQMIRLITLGDELRQKIE